jgi:heavy metal translocating P-type ATPase
MSARIFILRTIVALIAVLGLALHAWTGVEWTRWIGLLCYFVCLAMYVRALFTALVGMRKVTADLLVVTVMIVSLLADQPLGGALVAWFISMGLAVSWTIIEKTRRKIETLTRERETRVRIVSRDAVHEVPVEEVRIDDEVLVPQGEMIPVDGVIVQGEGSIDEAVITGEPFPVYKTTGETVTSGSMALDATFRIRALKSGDKGFVQVMAREMAASLQHKSATQRRAETIVQFFIAGVVVFALGLFFGIWAVTGDYVAGLMRMAAVTAVACPCAWALSVPTAFAAAIGGLGKRGILVRSGEGLELAGHAVNVVLDKTGTLTLGKPRVEKTRTFGISEDELLGLAVSIESGFAHPVANAIVAHGAARGIKALPVESSQYLPGMGIRSVIRGKEVILGGTSTVRSLGIDLPDETIGGRVTWVVVDSRVAGAFILQEELRDHASDLGRRLHGMGVRRIELATGDNEKGEAKRVADLIGADGYRIGLKPDEKTALVRTLKQQGVTLMVGDGINDSLSLAAADVGIAIGRAKADLAVKSSDIIVMREDAASLLTIMATGRKLSRIITQNYAWAIGFNLVGISLATTGILSPWLAALVHHVSSVLVVANSARLVRGSD